MGARTVTEKEVFLKLRRIQYLDLALARLRKERDLVLIHAADVKGINYEHTRRSGGKTDLAAVVERIEEKRAKLTDRILEESERVLQEKEEAMNMIRLCTNEAARAILTDRYLLGLKWEKVAKNYNYDPRHIRRIHSAAIKEISEKSKMS